MLISSLIAALLAVLVVVLAAVVFRKFGEEDEAPDGATAGHAGAMLSALFLMFFAIALIVPWTASDEENKSNSAAAQALVEAYWDAGELPAADRDTVRQEIKAYLTYVKDDEFPRLANGADGLDASGWKQLDALRARLTSVKTDNDDIKDARDNATERIREAYTARRATASSLGDILPKSVMVVTVLTGILMIVFPYLAGARPKGMPLILLGIMAAVLGVSVYMCFDLNNLFDGAFTVNTSAYDDALTEIQRIP